jgi:proteic killer suppression protein
MIGRAPPKLDATCDTLQLKGDRKGTFAVKVTGNWRVTFQWDDDGPLAVDLENCHDK